MRTVSPVLIYVTCWNMPTSVGWSEFSLWMGLWSVSWTLFPSQCYWVHSEQQTPQMLLFCQLLFYQMTLKAVKWGNFCTESKEATKVERACGDDVSWSSLPVWRHESSEMWRFISRLFVEGLDFLHLSFNGSGRLSGSGLTQWKGSMCLWVLVSSSVTTKKINSHV